MPRRRPRLVLPDGQPYTPSAAQWATLRLLAVSAPPWPQAWVPRDVFAARTRQDTAHRRACRTLEAHGVLERTPQGYRLPPSVRTQILAQ